jgi:hypothetical protein
LKASFKHMHSHRRSSQFALNLAESAASRASQAQPVAVQNVGAAFRCADRQLVLCLQRHRPH